MPSQLSREPYFLAPSSLESTLAIRAETSCVLVTAVVVMVVLSGPVRNGLAFKQDVRILFLSPG
jgi:hypothetical protein